MVEVQVDGQADVGRLSAVGRNYRIKSKLGNRKQYILYFNRE